MRSQNFITPRIIRYSMVFLALFGFLGLFAQLAAAQRIAILTPNANTQTREYAEGLKIGLAKQFKVLDDSLAEASFKSVGAETPFNLTLKEATTIGQVIGCDLFLLMGGDTLRRTSFEKPVYYEAFTAVYLVSAKTGRLIYWDIKSAEAASADEAKSLLFATVKELAAAISDKGKTAVKNELAEKNSLPIEEVPDGDYSKDKSFRPPLPFKRIKPLYTSTAYLYAIRATVDVSVDVDANGAITAAEIQRWAGYGLDDAVMETVKKMNWRPAERNGKTLPMRVLLRYNFTKIEKE